MTEDERYIVRNHTKNGTAGWSKSFSKRDRKNRCVVKADFEADRESG